MNFMEILNYLIPFATIVLSYVLGRVQEHHSYKKTVLKERYEKFYVPFLSLIYRGMLWNISDYSAESLESKSIWLDLIFNNIQYIDRHTQELLPEYYETFLNLLEFEDGNQQFVTAPNDYNRAFTNVVNSVLSESIKLSRKLRLPPLGTTAATNLSKSQIPQQMLKREQHSDVDHSL